MTRRERILTVTTLSLLGVMVSFFLFYFFVYEPMHEVRGQITNAQIELTKKQSELAQEQRKIEVMLNLNPRLSQWQKISIPPRPSAKREPGVTLQEQERRHRANVRYEYQRYLIDLLQTNGFQAIQVSERQPDAKTKLDTPKGQKDTYERFAYTVVGKANKDALVKMLAAFHKEPLLHQVRNLSVNLATTPGTTPSARGAAGAGAAAGQGGPGAAGQGGPGAAGPGAFGPGGARVAGPGGARAGATGGAARREGSSEGLLDVKMTVEALMVQGAEERPTLKPPTLGYPVRVLAESGRDYSVLAKRNVFTGMAPPRATTTAPVARQTENRADVLRFVRLTTLYYNPDRSRWEATLYDQATGPRRVEEADDDGNVVKKTIWERQLNTRILNELSVQDRYNNKILDGKVVHIDEKQLIFKVDESYFRLRCGDALYPAIEQPLDEEELQELGLVD